ncbi:MotA/TolQ/ExbB proton channel family protein [Desulfosarcina cetonica]|uniref:MotA/TolQ/ExbB proton channel family protein n=1 Tax=Desulfosarcina cetonica TaxID=90730 RepID=UPI00278C4DD6|nr:MotA/TolQ/ExbB proton channel family protein [Desulfosarcina cetonica]
MIDTLTMEVMRLEAYFRAGGVAMLPLALVSLAMWLLIVDRAIFFRRLYHKNMPLAIALAHIRDDRLPDPREYRGAVSLLVARFIQRRSHDRSLDQFILDETVLSINRSLGDHLAVIGVLAAIAPLLGLLGTVTGMIDTFDILSVFGTGNAKGMAGGISEALITTQTGLLVAIPGLYMKGFLDRRARNLQQRVARAGYHLRRQI